MSEKDTPNMTFNFYGGANQVLPNATHAEQHFYGDAYVERMLAREDEAAAPLTEDEKALLIYIGNEPALRGYITLLRSCHSARELGEVVVTISQQEPVVTPELIVKESFIRLLLPFVPKWPKGQSVDNIRVAINNVLVARKKTLPKHLLNTPFK